MILREIPVIIETRSGGVFVAVYAEYEQLQFLTDVNLISQNHSPVSFPMHWHQDVEIQFLPESAAGNAVLTVGSEKCEMEPGDILTIWPGELHEVCSNPHRELMTIQFPVTLLSERREFAVYMGAFRSCRLLRFSQNPERNRAMDSLARQMGQEAGDDPFPNVEKVIRLYQMFVCLGKSLKNQYQEEKKLNDATISKILGACQFIRDHCEDTLTLATAAKYAGFSPCYFSRYFKRVTSYGFSEYLTLQRIKRLQILLADDNLPVTDAMYQAGFKSVSTANRVFRQYCGCPPTEYRKCYRL